jgi:hypothetical protein
MSSLDLYRESGCTLAEAEAAFEEMVRARAAVPVLRPVLVRPVRLSPEVWPADHLTTCLEESK